MVQSICFTPVCPQLYEKRKDCNAKANGKDYHCDLELPQDEGLIVPHFWRWNWHWRVHHIILQLSQYPCVLQPQYGLLKTRL